MISFWAALYFPQPSGIILHSMPAMKPNIVLFHNCWPFNLSRQTGQKPTFRGKVV
jgi:hypothetical protein